MWCGHWVPAKKYVHLHASCFVLFKLLMHTLFAVKAMFSVFPGRIENVHRNAYTFGRTFSTFTLHLWLSIFNRGPFYLFPLYTVIRCFFSLVKSKCFICFIMQCCNLQRIATSKQKIYAIQLQWMYCGLDIGYELTVASIGINIF